MQKYEEVKRSRKQIMINNFLGGLAWAIGSTVGLAIFLAIAGFVLSNIDFIPVVGDFVTKINSYIEVKTSGN